MPTFNFELRDFGAALAKEEMSSSDKRREVAEHLEGEGTFEKEGGLAFEPLDFPPRYPLVFWAVQCTRFCDMCSDIEMTADRSVVLGNIQSSHFGRRGKHVVSWGCDLV